MRVITGTAKGRLIKTLDGLETRPTTQKVKEAIFSVLQFDIEGRRILDLFAGSGQMGIEALSRGASTAVFVDNSQKATSVIKDNIIRAGFQDRSEIYCRDSSLFLSSDKGKYDIVFVDPPYSKNMASKSLEALGKILSDHGIVVCEHDSHDVLPDKTESLEKIQTKSYGRICVSYYRFAL